MIIYTDGACSGNGSAAAVGGFAVIVLDDNENYITSYHEQVQNTTNNRMELTAVIEGLKALKESCKVTIVTDSQYVANGINLGWAESWKANGWRKKDKKPALNPELWDELLSELSRHEVTIEWIRGHAGHPENERCDELATTAADSDDLLDDVIQE